MVRNVRLTTLVVLLAGMFAPAAASPKPLLHPLFSDHVVLQRDVPVPVWGWAEPGRHVALHFGTHAAESTAGADGRWTVTLPAMAASTEPRVMSVTVEGPSGPVALEVRDVLVGEVWLCSGQSNMEFALEHASNGAAEVAAADMPAIRMFTTARTAAGHPLEVPAGGYTSWTPASPETAGTFSAVAWFFGRRLHDALHVPIGLIHTSWGGTPIEAWTSAEALDREASTREAARALDADTRAWDLALRDAPAVLERWLASRDSGSAGAAWADPRLDDRTWPTVDGPLRRWRDLGLPDAGGIVWCRRTIEVPAGWSGRDLVISLGPIAVRDRAWFDGQVIGDTLMPWESRTYTVPAALVRPGRHVLAVRVLADGPDGGFTGEPARMTASVEDEPPVEIAGGWRVAPGAPAASLGRVPYLVGLDPWVPAALYNGKIAPLEPFALKGFLWYQGEQNTSAPEIYGAELESLVADWRGRFPGARPFGIVQLANFGARSPEPWDSGWAALRDEQRRTLARVPDTGLAVTIDIGDAVDIHPKNKQDVGRRLAGWALATVYGRGGEWSGPLFRELAVDGSNARVSFDHVGGGLVARGGELRGFEIAGADRQFVRAAARLDGDAVVVSSPAVAAPVAVRYAWDDDPEIGLFNAQGLPASPFRTDDWPRRERPATVP